MIMTGFLKTNLKKKQDPEARAASGSFPVLCYVISYYAILYYINNAMLHVL